MQKAGQKQHKLFATGHGARHLISGIALDLAFPILLGALIYNNKRCKTKRH